MRTSGAIHPLVRSASPALGDVVAFADMMRRVAPAANCRQWLLIPHRMSVPRSGWIALPPKTRTGGPCLPLLTAGGLLGFLVGGRLRGCLGDRLFSGLGRLRRL